MGGWEDSSKVMRAAAGCVLLATKALAHSNLIYPKPRNAIDGNDPRWAHGLNSPDLWERRQEAVHASGARLSGCGQGYVRCAM